MTGEARRRPTDAEVDNTVADIETAIIAAGVELVLESSCTGHRYGRNTAHELAARLRHTGRIPTATPYLCPACHAYHVGPTPSLRRLELIAAALRGLTPGEHTTQ